MPPDACFANFRGEDCGREPVRVLYYWKPGSRCEVGVWRGCLPNMNMFDNEYECVATCIFTARAESIDYHNLNEEDKTDNILDGETTTETTTTIYTNETIIGSTDSVNSTGTVASGNLTTGGADDNSTDTQTETGKMLRTDSLEFEEDLPYVVPMARNQN